MKGTQLEIFPSAEDVDERKRKAAIKIADGLAGVTVYEAIEVLEIARKICLQRAIIQKVIPIT